MNWVIKTPILNRQSTEPKRHQDILMIHALSVSAGRRLTNGRGVPAKTRRAAVDSRETWTDGIAYRGLKAQSS
jgi:hypothetical protein